jgi:hypothetical protein
VIVSQPEFDSVSPGGIYVKKQKASIYTVLLVVSLVALLFGCLFLLLEIREYGGFGEVSGPLAAADVPGGASNLPVIERPAIPPAPTLFALVD